MKFLSNKRRATDLFSRMGPQTVLNLLMNIRQADDGLKKEK